MITPFTKDPDAVLDYPFDWSTNLGADTIQTSTFIADAGIVVESDAILDDAHTVIWLSGGTPDKRYAITNHVLTIGGREDDWTIYILVKEQ